MIFTPFGPSAETFVDIAPGSSTTRIAQQLESAGVIRSQFAFDLWRWVRKGKLKAGEYRFDHPAPLTDVYDRIARADVYTVAVTVPEGATIFDVAARLEQAGIGTREEFLEQQPRLAELVADIDPKAKTLEGYLFPDTYRFPRTTTPAQVATAMVRRFRVVATEIGLKENVHDVVTLASLVERETAVDAERPLVASVFENRLAKHMPLMTDPSVIYGLAGQGCVDGNDPCQRSEARYAVQHLPARGSATRSGRESGVAFASRSHGSGALELPVLCRGRRKSAGQIAVFNNPRRTHTRMFPVTAMR